MNAFDVSFRRASCRREAVIPCQAVREHDFKLIADRTLDVSLDGLLVPLRARVLTGESIIVSFPIPGMWIDAEGTIARIIHGRRPGDTGLAAGILFHPLPSAARAALAGFLHGRGEPTPLRRPRTAPAPADATSSITEDVTEDVSVDGLDLLRAVVGAWRRLNDETAPFANAVPR